MNRIPPDVDDGPELVPPADLLRLRSLLMRGPRVATRARHLAVATTEARQRPLVAGAAGRLATWGGRVAVGVVASLAITSGLAGAQLLPQPAQRLLSGVSARFAPPAPTPPSTTVADPADPIVASSGGSKPSPDRRDRRAAEGSGPGAALTDEPDATSPPTTEAPSVDTTLPGPPGPGSPTDPTTEPDDPDQATTTTTEPEPTTTTTSPPPTTTTTSPPPTTTTPSSSR